MKISLTLGLPSSLSLNRLSFVAWCGGEFFNLNQLPAGHTRQFICSYWYNGGEAADVSRAVAIIEEPASFSLEIRSTLWRVAEISVERQNEWLIFSRQQKDLSTNALTDFLVGSQNLLSYFRDESVRLVPTTTEIGN